MWKVANTSTTAVGLKMKHLGLFQSISVDLELKWDSLPSFINPPWESYYKGYIDSKIAVLQYYQLALLLLSLCFILTTNGESRMNPNCRGILVMLCGRKEMHSIPLLQSPRNYCPLSLRLVYVTTMHIICWRWRIMVFSSNRPLHSVFFDV